jgi:GNAT superfamily N-acetyltransferase
MVHIRAPETTEQDRLWQWLHIALWDPPPAPPRPVEVLENPQVRIDADAWGSEGDVGVVGELEGDAVPLGAYWMRRLPAVDARTPQLGIALLPAHQGKGHGRSLMLAALDAAPHHGYGQVSLTVHPRNPAIGMYERCGFVKNGVRNSCHLMIAKL